jgi:CrcB protein
MSEPPQATESMTVPGRQRLRGTQEGTAVTTEEAIAEGELAHAPHDAPLPPVRSVWRERLVTIGAVSAGGFLGANARYLVGLGVSERFGAVFPWGTLLINVSGSYVLGFYLTLVTERFVGRSTTRLFLATGFLGAYTTFSTFSYETVQLMAEGASLSALAYVVASLLLGIAAAVAGILSAHAL